MSVPETSVVESHLTVPSLFVICMCRYCKGCVDSALNSQVAHIQLHSFAILALRSPPVRPHAVAMIPSRRAKDSSTVTIKLGKLALLGIVMSKIITTPTRERSARLTAVMTVAFVLYSVKYDMARITRDIFAVEQK